MMSLAVYRRCIGGVSVFFSFFLKSEKPILLGYVYRMCIGVSEYQRSIICGHGRLWSIGASEVYTILYEYSELNKPKNRGIQLRIVYSPSPGLFCVGWPHSFLFQPWVAHWVKAFPLVVNTTTMVLGAGRDGWFLRTSSRSPLMGVVVSAWKSYRYIMRQREEHQVKINVLTQAITHPQIIKVQHRYGEAANKHVIALKSSKLSCFPFYVAWCCPTWWVDGSTYWLQIT
jgi:hypothetical protein